MSQAVAGFGRGLVQSVMLALLLVLSCGVQANAHATLTGVAPADGAVLSAPPEEVVLSFNEPVSVIAATLILPGGTTRPLDQFTSDASSVSIALPAALVEGSHALSWRAVSEDGHPISGTTFFAIGAASATPLAEGPQQDRLVAVLLWSARLVLFIGIFFGIGGAAFRILAEVPPLAGRIARWTSIGGLVAAPAVLGLQGLDLMGGGLGQFGDSQAWQLGLTSPYGTTVGLAGVALLLALVTLSLGARRPARLTATIAILLAGLAISASGHASAADPRWLTRPALFIHVTTIAWWVGALFPLILLLRQEQHLAAPALLRFSRAIPFAIVPLIGSGAVIATIQLGPPGPAWWSPYGQVLAAKLSLLVVLFAIASWNRWILTAPAAAGDGRALRHMRRGIAAEIVLILAVLGLVCIWRFTPPPRALVAREVAPVLLTLSDKDLQAALALSPGRVGQSSVDITIRDDSGKLLSPKSVRVAFEPASGAIAPIVRSPELQPDGTWHLDGVNLPLAGSWLVEVEVRVSDFELAKLGGTLAIMP